MDMSVPVMNFYDITTRAMGHFGCDAQVDQLIEELDELKKALIKFKECGPIASSHVAEEMADVNIVMIPIQRELKLQAYLTDWTNIKLARLNEILKKSGKVNGYE